MAAGSGDGINGRVVEVTNSGLQIFNKNGGTVAGPTSLNVFLGTSAGAAFDPKVLFDQHSGRFFIVILEGNTPNPGGTSNMHIAVSTSSTPSNLTTNWAKLNGSALTTVGTFNTWCDYPGIGADSGSLFVTCSLFDSTDTQRGTKIRVFDKSPTTGLLAGAAVYSFQDIDVDVATTPGIFTVQPAHVFGTTDNGNFYLINRFGPTFYRLWEISGTPSAPVLEGNATRPWTAGTILGTGAPQSGTSITIDLLSARCQNAVYRNGHVWTALTSDTDGDSKSEVFWAKIATNGGLPAIPTVADSGSINGSDTVEWTFMPSISVNSTGDAVITYSQSFSDQFPEMRYVTRLATDPAGTFGASVVPPCGTSPGFYDDFNATNPERWGDYAAAVVDPDDDGSFWVAHEVVKTSGVNTSLWGTCIARLNPVDLIFKDGFE